MQYLKTLRSLSLEGSWLCAVVLNQCGIICFRTRSSSPLATNSATIMWFHKSFQQPSSCPSCVVAVYLQGRNVACKGHSPTAHSYFNASCEMINEVYSYNKSKLVSPKV